MSNILISVDDQNLNVTANPKIASEGVKEDYVIFTLDSNLAGYGLTAVFWKEDDEDTVYQSAVNASGKALVPWEVTDTEGKIYIGLCGVKDDVIYTSEVIKYKIVKGKYGGSASSVPPTPGIYEQMLAVAASMHEEYDTLNTVLSAKIDAETSARQTGDTSLTAQIAAERARIDALVAGGSSSVSETVLFDGDARYSGTSYTLADSVANYDYLDIYTYCYGWRKCNTIPVEENVKYDIVHFNLADYTSLPGAVSTPMIEGGEFQVVFSGTTMTIQNHTYYRNRADQSGDPVAGQVSTSTTYSPEIGGKINKVIGRKKIANTEVEDIRTGYDGTIYSTAGAAVRGQVGGINTTLSNSLVLNTVYISNWTQGTINGTTGATSGSNTRCRSGYMQFKTVWDRVTIIIPDGYKMSARIYSDNSGTYIEGSPFSENSLTIQNVNPDYYYRFVIAYTDDSNITPSDISDESIYYILYSATDKTLTLEGKAADAKTTGDYIRAVETAKNLINNTLNPVADPKEMRPTIGKLGYFLRESALTETAEHGIKLISKWDKHVFSGGFVVEDITADDTALEVGKEYVLSFDVEYKLYDPTSAITRYISVYLVEADDEHELPAMNNVSSSLASTYTTIDQVTQDKKGVAQTAKAAFVFSLQPGTKKYEIVIRGSSNMATEYGYGDYIELKNIMLQEGNYPTKWIPSTFDVSTGSVSPVVKRNDPDEMLDKLQQLNRPKRTGSRTLGTPPLCFIHFSDIHGDEKCLANIEEFRAYYSDYIADVVHTGDSVTTTSADGMDFWDNVSGAETFLNCIGNHDSRVGSDWYGLDESDCYNAYIAPYVSNWNLTSYTEGKCYYYKDYSAGIRLIMLDIMHQSAEQLAWFINALSNAKTNGKHVVVGVHSRPHWKLNPINTAWDDVISAPYTPEESDSSASTYFPSNMAAGYSEAVTDFIDNGGIFVCWLHGHTHYKICATLVTDNRQLDIAVAEAGGTDYAWTYVQARIPGTKTEDNFNLVAIEPDSKILRMVKVGVQYDRLMRYTDTFSYDYENRIILTS